MSSPLDCLLTDSVFVDELSRLRSLHALHAPTFVLVEKQAQAQPRMVRVVQLRDAIAAQAGAAAARAAFEHV